MPKPNTGESREHFLNRCMADSEANSTFPDSSQRYAFCVSQFETKAMANKLDLYKNVGEEITVDAVRNFLNSQKGADVQFDISTLGGDLGTAITIYDLIKSYPGKTTANIVGLTASAGTVIAIACDEVVMSDNSLFLIHNGWQEVTGNRFDLEKATSDLIKMDAIMVKVYHEKTGLPHQKISDLMKASDWLSPSEALQYGFVDRVQNSGVKIAASVIISEAQGQINKLLLTKLEQKMSLNPFKKANAQASVFNVLALKDNSQLLINAEEVAAGVEIAAPLGAMLEDGEYELADGRKIVVAGGVVTEVKEMAPPPAGEVNSEAIIAAVADVVKAAIQPIQAELDTLKAAMAKVGSTHTPAKGTTVATPKAEVKKEVGQIGEDLTSRIMNKIKEERKA